MRSGSIVGRIAAIGAVVAAIVVVAIVFFSSSGDTYKVKAIFENGGQLVKGNSVVIGGTPAGTVDDIKLTDDGRAVVEVTVDEKYKPLCKGTKATIRQFSQSGIANRYVDFNLPTVDPKKKDASPQEKCARGDGQESGTIEDGDTIGIDDTVTAVELDQLFNTLDPPTRKALQKFLKGVAEQYTGRADQANAGFHYLNPALSTSSRFFNELSKDQPVLERFLVDSAKLVTTLAERRDDLAGLIANLNTTFRAIGSEKEALADLIGRFPDFMRTANTTFVNLRTTLDDVDPLVDASKPVAKKLQRFLPELRAFTRGARPTIADLNDIVLKSGKDNDLVDLTKTFPGLASIALDTKRRSVSPGGHRVSVGRVPGAFPATVDALEDSAPIIAFGRPYTVDMVGWFDDFSNTGVVDALGGISRVQVYFNAFTIQNNIPTPLNLEDRGQDFKNIAKLFQYKRCPGGAEVPASDGSNVLSAAEQRELDCTEEHRAPTK
jgi:phospholipid/cholesterol/gamma-HCH transport system substrate-binding protein